MTGEQNPSSGAPVQLKKVTRRFGPLVAVDRLDLFVPEGSFYSLLGPSGCGKSTTLRMIAGFERPDEGNVYIGGKDVTHMEARRRPTAMVFQNYALFPNMTVGENVAYGLKVRRKPGTEIARLVSDVLRRVDLGGLENTAVTQLSGGQQQRTALARAVAVEPRVILFDEPLSNLDVSLRHQTRRELKQLQHRMGLTSIYVTHDQEEALALSDLISVMRNGRIIQSGPPRELYDHPQTAFVASFLGRSNLVHDAQHGFRLTGESPPSGSCMSIRPEHIRVSDVGAHEGEVISRQFLGMTTELMIRWENLLLRSLSPIEAEMNGDRARFDVTDFRIVIDDVK